MKVREAIELLLPSEGMHMQRASIQGKESLMIAAGEQPSVYIVVGEKRLMAYDFYAALLVMQAVGPSVLRARLVMYGHMEVMEARFGPGLGVVVLKRDDFEIVFPTHARRTADQVMEALRVIIGPAGHVVALDVSQGEA